MTIDEKLAAILAAVQTDPGNRGLARDPHDNLFTATAGDFQAACRELVVQQTPAIVVSTGFYIPSANPPAYETDGPLGAIFLVRAFQSLGLKSVIDGVGAPVNHAAILGLRAAGLEDEATPAPDKGITHVVSVERGGPAKDNRYRTMRGLDITPHQAPTAMCWWEAFVGAGGRTIGIGDGGNEIGMGKIPHETIVKNIPNGELIHCRVPTDHLIVCGVSNWGAYALAAGVYVLRGVKPPADLFDPDREREILEVMVREGPLVDGVTGQQTATVDGLTWDEYAAPLIRIREILET